MANVALPTNAVDLEGLDSLRRRAHRDDPSAVSDVAVQFEALFIGMMLESARSATLSGGLFDGPETEQYLSLMDRQVALELARQGGFGFGKMLEEQLKPHDATAPAQALALTNSRPPRAAELGRAPQSPVLDAAARPLAPTAPVGRHAGEFPRGLPSSLATLGGVEPPAPPVEPTPAQFVTSLLPHANAAATALGIEPRLLLAQAALETGWGRAVPQRGAESAHNLFGIKAGPSWDGAAVERLTLEHEGGVTEPQLGRFKAYGSPAESFADYADLIGTARRYAAALENAGEPDAYARALTKAGYATDPHYADKWLSIYHGDRLENAMRGIDLPPQAP
ncbi:MAG TPA: flagellar assembly peptidoglycan hydrolase FlgJ [Gammaproteobacteria bacterium]|nr:flagellar assembly peptidoglycan hydrolase FlgJ [Gammaproteobacteria bacterium]